jgi:hypothetical protein
MNLFSLPLIGANLVIKSEKNETGNAYKYIVKKTLIPHANK